jgi:hypothetical protein
VPLRRRRLILQAIRATSRTSRAARPT